jgi:hypothetical protein
MIYALLADGILLLHLAFVLFVIFGGLLSLRSPWWALVHVPIFVWGAMVNLMHWVCPLTPWENELRALAGEEGYAGGFIAHYVGSVVYPQIPSEQLGLLLGLAALIWNLLVYALVIALRYRRFRARSGS